MDCWSCGVVLFVLLVGNTPWDEPTGFSPEFRIYCNGPARFLKYDPWNRIDPEALCMCYLLCLLIVSPRLRTHECECGRQIYDGTSKEPPLGSTVIPAFCLSDHRPNRMLTEAGYLADPLSLAQRLMEKLQVDLNADVPYPPEMLPLSRHC